MQSWAKKLYLFLLIYVSKLPGQKNLWHIYWRFYWHIKSRRTATAVILHFDATMDLRQFLGSWKKWKAGMQNMGGTPKNVDWEHIQGSALSQLILSLQKRHWTASDRNKEEEWNQE